MFRFKFIYSFLVLTLSFFFLETLRAKDNKVRLVYWPSSNPQEIELARFLVEKWNRENPDIEVNMQPLPASRSSEEVLLTSVAAKTTPDVCSNIWPGSIPDYIDAGAVIRLNDFEDFNEYAGERVPEQVLESFRSIDGNFYQMPWKGNPIMIEYNINMFKEAGITEPPRTYSEFLEAARKLTKDRDGDGNIDQWMGIVNVNPVWWYRFFDFYALYIAASGGKTLIKNEKVIFNNEYAVSVFQFLQDCFKNGYFPKGTFQGHQFLLGNVAVQFTGPWDISFIEKHKSEDFEYDFIPLPVPDNTEGPTMTFNDPKNIVIFSTTEHPEEAWKFVKFLVSKRADLELLKKCSQIPFRKDLDTDPYFSDYFDNNTKMIRFAKQMPFTKGTDNISELREIFDIIAQSFEYCCIYNRQSPQEAIRDAAETSQKIIERY